MTVTDLHGYVPNFHAPDCFKIRCTECGKEELYADRGKAVSAADSHAFNCGSTGVTPLAFKPRQIPLPDTNEQASVVYQRRETDDLRIIHGTVLGTEYLYRKPTRLLLKVQLRDQNQDREFTARFDPNGFSGGSVRQSLNGRFKRLGGFRALRNNSLSCSDWPQDTSDHIREKVAEECKTGAAITNTTSDQQVVEVEI